MAGLILQLFTTHSTKFELIWRIFFSYLKVQFTNMHKQFTYYLDFLYSQHALTAEVVSSKLSIKGNILFMLFNFSMKKTRLNFVLVHSILSHSSLSCVRFDILLIIQAAYERLTSFGKIAEIFLPK